MAKNTTRTQPLANGLRKALNPGVADPRIGGGIEQPVQTMIPTTVPGRDTRVQQTGKGSAPVQTAGPVQPTVPTGPPQKSQGNAPKGDNPDRSGQNIDPVAAGTGGKGDSTSRTAGQPQSEASKISGQGAGILGGLGQMTADITGSVLNELSQIAGLLRIDQAWPTLTGNIQGINREMLDAGNNLWGSTNSRTFDRADQAANWQSGRGDTSIAAKQNYDAEKARLTGQLDTAETERRGAINAFSDATRTAFQTRDQAIQQSKDFVQDMKNRGAAAMEQFQVDRQATLDAIKQNFQYDVQSVRSAADGQAKEMMNKTMAQLKRDGLAGVPGALLQAATSIKKQWGEQMHKEVGTRMAQHENTVANVNAQLTQDRAMMNTQLQSILQSSEADASKVRTQADEQLLRQRTLEADGIAQINNSMQLVRKGVSDGIANAFERATTAAQTMGNYLNSVDREIAATNYSMLAAFENGRLAAEAFAAQGVSMGANALSNWTHVIPNIQGAVNGAIEAVRGGGGGGGGKQKMGGGATIAGYGANFSCVDADCVVETTRGSLTFHGLQVGDRALGGDGKFHRILRIDLGRVPPDQQSSYRWAEVRSGASTFVVCLTKEHTIGGRQWGDFKRNDLIETSVGTGIITKIQTVGYRIGADIELEGCPNYVVGGVIVDSMIAQWPEAAKQKLDEKTLMETK